MKKIAFVSWDFSVLGGINQVIVTLANKLCEKNEVYIISLTKKNQDNSYKLNEKITPVFYAIDRECRGRKVIFEAKKRLKDFLKTNDIKLLFLMGFQVALPVIIMTERKYKYVFCEHEALMSRWNEKKITIVRFITALCAHKIVTLTEMTANDYKRKFHLPSDKVSYIYNSIGEDVIKNRSDYDENSKTILSVGRFSPEKGYDILIDIAEQVFEKYEDWNWVIYGDGDTFSQIKQEIENRDLDNKIILKGQVKDVSKIYRNAAFFVLTSLREGLPLVLLEAKANHIPCLSFDVISGPREIIRNEVDGFLISPYDKEKMIQCIEKLICNDSLRKNMSLEADSNLDLFDEKIIMQKWNALIDQL